MGTTGALTALGVVQAFAVGLVLHLLHAGAHEAHAPAPVLHWLRDSALAVPASVAALAAAAGATRGLLAWAGMRAEGRVAQLVWSLAGAVAYATASVPGNWAHARLFGAEHAGMPFLAHAVHDAGVVLVWAFAVLAVAALLRGLPWQRRTRRTGRAPGRSPRPRRRARLVLALALAAVLAGGAAGPGLFATSPAEALAEGECPTGSREITYDVAAFQSEIPLNGWGDRVLEGLMYGLKNPDARVGKDDILANPNRTQPLVIRANVGDCVRVKLRNDIRDRRVGMHTDGLLRGDPKASDGARVGRNPDTTVASDQEIVYTWYAQRQGEAPLYDVANLDAANPNHATIARGLYGAVIVHPKGSTWHNQKTGDDLLDPSTLTASETQVFADVRVPDGNDYRSFAMVFLDENEDVKDRSGNAPTFPTTGLQDSTFGINYRSEPLRNRLRAIIDHRAGKTVTLPNGRVIQPTDHFCDGYVPSLDKVVEDPGAKCESEESHLQSWIFGDEGKLLRRDAEGNLVRDAGGTPIVDSDNLIPKAYRGDAVKFHLIHPGAKETHPWHQHTHRWFADPNKTDSPRNDVQSTGPGEARELNIEGGAGGGQQTIGDSIFHCHLYPHFAQGFWGHFRVFDRLRDGTQTYPDGTPLERLHELPDRAGQTPAPDAQHPGFPLFVKGDVGQRAYRPPYGVIKDTFADRKGADGTTPYRRPGDAPRRPTELEAANLPALDPAKPGAGFIDPCPTGTNVRTYKPHAVDVPITYNSAGWKDRQGRVYVEESHRDAVLAGSERPEPYTIRARVGECVQVQLTNDLHLDDDPNVPLDRLNKKDGEYMKQAETSEVSTHVHLVKYDELGSDGTSVGWNYVQAAMPGQTYGARWFVDQPLRTIFFHDHQYANLHQQKGLFAAMNVEPLDATWHDPKTGAQTDGVGPVADIHVPGTEAAQRDFREFTVFHQDRAPMWKNDGAGPAIEPPGVPDDFGADQGGYALNYRNEPFQIRTGPDKPGQKGDPAYVYSSAIWGDPSTPVFRAYHTDPVVIRNVAGSHEEMHTFNVHGHRWLNESDNPQSEPIDNQALSVAEYFNYEVQGSSVNKKPASAPATAAKAGDQANGAPHILAGGAGLPGDYLYGSTPLDDQWLGLWGIFRVPGGLVGDLQKLPDGRDPGTGAAWPALKPGDSLAPAPKDPAKVCPVDAPKRRFSVSAIQHDIVYNAKTGDHDPNGVLYVLSEDEAAVRAGTKRAEPLFLRASAGDCVELTLTNKLPAGGVPDHTGDVPLPADAPFPKGARVSMHPSLVKYDPTRSDGATVGYNFDQTVAPGASITYVWHADSKLIGGSNLVDFGDRRGHRHHGLWGGLMLEPPGATWTDPATGLEVRSGANADVKWTAPDGTPRAFREFVVDFQDGLNLRDRAGQPIPVAGEVEDPYEEGNRAINYRTERFAPRLAANPEPAWVMSSEVHGDPATPVLQAYAGDPVWIRLLQGQDRGRAHSFLLHGHGWRDKPADPNSMIRTGLGGLMPGRSFNLGLLGGAGGEQQSSGDYLYRDGLLPNQVNAGLWGLLRVHGTEQPGLRPLK